MQSRQVMRHVLANYITLENHGIRQGNFERNRTQGSAQLSQPAANASVM